MHGWDIMPRIISAGIWKNVEIKKKKKNKINEVFITKTFRDYHDGKATVRCFINFDAERVVYRDSATPDSQIGMANIRPDNARSMFWVFEDVKFLGWNDGLEFGHTSTGSQELTTDFIFKRLIRVDPMYLENYLGGTIGKAFELTSINDSVISSELKIKSNYEKV